MIAWPFATICLRTNLSSSVNRSIFRMMISNPSSAVSNRSDAGGNPPALAISFSPLAAGPWIGHGRPRTLRKAAMRFKILTLAFAPLAFSSIASAATPIYWAPAKMASALTALQYPHAGTIGGACKGLGKPRHGGYTGFRCTMTWQIAPTGGTTSSGKVTAWARPLAKGRVCGSTSSLAACRLLAAGPLPGDPRVCTLHPTDPDACTRDAAQLAIVKKVGPAQSDCTKVSTFVYRCTYGGDGSTAVYTVTFTKGASGWATTVAP